MSLGPPVRISVDLSILVLCASGLTLGVRAL